GSVLAGRGLRCCRCGSSLSRCPPLPIEVALALATTALILFLLANAYPIFLISLEGRAGQDLLISGPLRLSEYGGPFAGLGMLVAGLSFVVPLVWMCLVVIVLAGLRWGDPALHARFAPLWKTALLLYPWSMLDVYLLGTYVAYTRLADAVETNVATGGYAPGALASASAILYLPANLLPVMTVERFGQVSTYTILAGVEELLHLGLWPLALLVFFASVVVPMAKLISLAWFLHMIRRRSARWLRERTRLYRFID